MKTRIANIIISLLVVFTFLLAIILYPKLPPEIPSHWNMSGEVDSTTGKLWGIFLLPTIMLGMFILWHFIPKIDPLRKNIELFKKQYNLFFVILSGFLASIFVFTLLWSLGHELDILPFLIPGLSVLLYAVGHMIERSKRNWFIGVRTPWTLSSDVVWDKTNAFSALLFKMTAFISLLGLIFRNTYFTFWFLLIAIVSISVASIGYSYVVFLEENKKKK